MRLAREPGWGRACHIAAVRRPLKLVTVLILVVLLPLRAVAGVGVGYCASGHQGMAVPMLAHGHGGETNAHDTQGASSSCSMCVVHCSSAAFVPSTVASLEISPVGSERMDAPARRALAFFPNRLDRPPLA